VLSRAFLVEHYNIGFIHTYYTFFSRTRFVRTKLYWTRTGSGLGWASQSKAQFRTRGA